MSFIFYTLSIVQFAKEFEEATDKKQYIENALPLIKDEIESNSIDVQKKGIQKLLFCEMFGVHKNWAVCIHYYFLYLSISLLTRNSESPNSLRIKTIKLAEHGIEESLNSFTVPSHVAAQCLLSRSSPLTLILVNLLQKELSDANPVQHSS